jgi:hypothetical protein
MDFRLHNNMGFILFFVCLGAWQIASHLSLPIRCIFIPKVLSDQVPEPL